MQAEPHVSIWWPGSCFLPGDMANFIRGKGLLRNWDLGIANGSQQRASGQDSEGLPSLALVSPMVGGEISPRLGQVSSGGRRSSALIPVLYREGPTSPKTGTKTALKSTCRDARAVQERCVCRGSQAVACLCWPARVALQQQVQHVAKPLGDRSPTSHTLARKSHFT